MFNEKARLQIRTGDNPEIWTDVSSFNGGTALPVHVFNSLVKVDYDYVSLSYTGDNLTSVVFKTGGAGGTTVATVTMTYDANDNLLTAALS